MMNKPSMNQRLFGMYPQGPGGKPVTSYILDNGNGARAVILDYGATLQSLIVPDAQGNPTDVVLGYYTMEDYINDDACLGATIGRCCNRTENARFTLNDQIYTLASNESVNNLHSGPNGYHQRRWLLCSTEVTEHAASVSLRLSSPDGDQGFPGDLTLYATYTLTDTNALIIHYHARCSQDTMVNITNHAYYNLDGESTGHADSNILWINADEFLPIDAACLPCGPYRNVTGTPFDFRTPKPIGQDADPTQCEQLSYTHGYNHSYRLRKNASAILGDTAVDSTVANDFPPARHFLAHKGITQMPLAAIARGTQSGIIMRLYTNLPDLELYTGDYLMTNSKNGHPYLARAGYALEAQYAPNSMNAANPTDRPILRKEDDYDAVIRLEFSATR